LLVFEFKKNKPDFAEQHYEFGRASYFGCWWWEL